MRTCSYLFVLLCSCFCFAQKNHISIPEVDPPAKLDNIFVKNLFSDSLETSSFLIFIKNEVKTHKHNFHSEQVYVLEGSGEMKLGSESFRIKKGDFIFIPKNTFHSVKTTSKKPLKVVSIQAPFFDGKDRVFE